MTKMKSRKSIVKRYKITGGSRIKRKKAFKSHIMEKKSSKRKTRLSRGVCLKKGDANVLVKVIIGFKNI